MSDKSESSPGNGAATDPQGAGSGTDKAAEKPAEKPANGEASAKTEGKAESKPEARSEKDLALDALAEAKADAQKNRDQWVRSAADFDNFRKRARRDIDDAKKAGREELLKDFLPVFDNLERALVSAQRATEVKPVVDGLTMVMKQFADTLGRSGIQKVPTKGAQFDPTMHEAIQQVESDETPGTVVAEVQAGYLQGERLVRAALVVVAQPRASQGASQGASPGASPGAAQAASPAGAKDETQKDETQKDETQKDETKNVAAEDAGAAPSGESGASQGEGKAEG